MVLQISLAELGELVGGELRGDGALVIDGVGSLAKATRSRIALFGSAKLRAQALRSEAGAFVVGSDLADELDRPGIVCRQPAVAMVRITERFHPRRRPPAGVHPTAVVAASARVAASAMVGPFVVVGEDSEIGEDVELEASVVVGRGCVVGAGSRLHPQVVLYDDVRLGERVEVHSGTVLGADGFGYVPAGRALLKVPQVGGVDIGDDAEIGANSAVDRATFDRTVIGAGTKLDNSVQVGHNAQIGPSCLLCGQVGVAGSVTLGTGVVLGGRAGVADHVTVADGVQVAGGSIVLQSASQPGEKLGGYPARSLASWQRDGVWSARLGELFRRVRSLELRGEGREEKP